MAIPTHTTIISPIVITLYTHVVYPLSSSNIPVYFNFSVVMSVSNLNCAWTDIAIVDWYFATVNCNKLANQNLNEKTIFFFAKPVDFIFYRIADFMATLEKNGYVNIFIGTTCEYFVGNISI